MGRDARSPQELANCASYYVSAAVEQSVVATTDISILLGARVLIDAALGADRWLQVFSPANKAVPPNGTVAYYQIAIPGTAIEAFDDFPRGLLLPNGIVLAMSSTFGTLTATAAENWRFQVFYVS